MNYLLQTNNLTKKYKNFIAVNNVNMTINKGEIYGLIGKNGAGKTTIMRMILGTARPTSGSYSYAQQGFSKKIGSVIEAPALFEQCTAYENMKRYSILFGGNDADINRLLDMVGLGFVKKKKAREYSLGMRQRLGIAIALLSNPEFLVLDEPINGLDPAGIMEVRDLITKLNREQGITFMISSHLLEELSKVATKFGIIDRGCLIEEITSEQLFERCQKRLEIYADNLEKAVEIASGSVKKENIIRCENHIVLIDDNVNAAMLNKQLIESGVMVEQLVQRTESLEQYFIGKVGQ